MKKTAAAKIPEPVTPARPFRKYAWGLAILTFLVFANTLSNGYNMDDELVTRSHRLTSRGLEAIGDIFTQSYYQDDQGYAYGYRPVVHLSFALEHAMFGEKPEVSHFFNVLLYVLAVVSFFHLIRKWAGENGLMLAVVAALLFSLHPVHTEAVASIKNRDEILAFLFTILAGLSVQRYIDKDKLIHLLWTALFFAIAMLSKKSVFPMAILFPTAIILLKNPSWKKIALISVTLIIPAAVIGSEFIPMRMLWMIVVSLAGISVMFLVRNIQPDYLKDFRLYSIISWILLGIGLYFSNYPILLVSGIFLATALWFHLRWGAIQFLIQALIVGIIFKIFTVPLYAGFLVSIIYFLNRQKKKNKKIPWIALAILLLGVGTVTLRIQFLPIHYALLPIPLIYLILAPKISLSHLRIFSITGIIFTFIFLLYKNQSLLPDTFQSTLTKPKLPVNELLKIKPDEKTILKEGRFLERVENTLTQPHSTQETIGTGAVTLGEYMRLMVFPYELSFYYGYARTQTVGLNNPWVWVSIFIHFGLILLAFWQLKRRPLISIGIGWYLLSILLFSNWVELVAGMVGERLAFTASAGFCLFLASLVFWIKPQLSIKKPGVAGWITIAVVCLFLVKTIFRNAQWKDPLTLMSADIRHLGNSAQANNLYAMNLMQTSLEDRTLTEDQRRDRQQRALGHFDRALEIAPEFYNAAYDKGRAGLFAGDTSAAISGFEHAIRLENTSFKDPYYQLADLYLGKRRVGDYLALSKKTLDIDPENVNAYNNLARGYFINGYADSARIILEKGIQKFPNDPDLKMNLKIVSTKSS